MKFGLALGGGAARGLAHIGVIKYLEENNLKASEISGTSMGSIVASFYAFGKTSKEMEKIAGEINYLKLIDFNFRNGLITGNKIKTFFEGIFGKSKIEDAKIPLKIMATDINTGIKNSFTKGSVVEAIRSSISIPGILIPNKIRNKDYIDGGVINNLPIDELKSKNIIAVSVLRDTTRPLNQSIKILGFNIKHNLIGMSYQILQKTLDIMMKQNEERSLKCGKNIILISPKFPEIDYYEFHKFKEIIEIGYNEAKNQNLKELIKKFGKHSGLYDFYVKYFN